MKFTKIAHRGASNIAPENTLKAFKAAIELKADYIEFDLFETKEGLLVITHDEDTLRLTGHRGKVKDMTLEELKKLDFGDGERIPTLHELISTTKGKIGLQIEIKAEHISEKVIKILREQDLIKSTIISSFLHDELLKIQKIEPNVRLASLEPTFYSAQKLDWSKKKEMIQYCIDNNLYAIHPLYTLVDKQFVDFSHENNIKVHPWTVDSKIAIKKLIKWGVDGIITNKIALLTEILNNYA
jgi:glycerophosphoryl diester phosphodiesterase